MATPDTAVELPELTCDVCHGETAVGVVAVPGVPISVAYGRACLEANAHPYEIIVGNTAMIGGYKHAPPWWQQMIDDTLRHLSKDRDAFDAQVRVEIAAYEEWERQDRAAWEAEQVELGEARLRDAGHLPPLP